MAQRRARLAKAFSSLLCVALLGGVVAAAPAVAAPEQDPVFAAELAALADGTTYDALVHLAPDVAAPRAFLTGRGFQVHDVFQTVDVYHVTGPVVAFRELTQSPEVVYLEANRRLRFRDETAAWATGARIAQQSVSGGPYLDSQGRPLTGAGVGVAVVDSGINATHPDVQKRIVKNFKWHCASIAFSNTSTERCYGATVFLGEVQGTSDTTSGHGSHVAGIVAGDGTASEGTFTGVAPGASLYGFGVGEVIFVANAAEAFEYILTNYDDRSKLPVPIKVINNSWGDDDADGDANVEGPAYSPNSLLSKLTKQLVAKGVTMVYAAGNGDDATAGDDGTHFNTSSTCQDPTPGVICVANYDDAALAKKDGALNASSSRGKAGVTNTYPDVSAPGTNITSACIRQVQPICNVGVVDETRWAPYYGTISGTSMAAPHVSGIIAMMLQARPDLTPAQIEDALLDTASKFTTKDRLGRVVPYEADPQNPDDTTSYDKGAGLVDVPAALADIGITGANTASPAAPVSGDGGDFSGPGGADIVGMTVAEEAAGMRYAIQVRNVSDVAPGLGLRLTQLVNGANRMTSVNVTATGATPGAVDPARNNTIATQVAVDRTRNTVSFLIPFESLGNPGPATPAHGVYLASYINGVADVAPGGLGAELLIRPRFGSAYTIHPVTSDPTVPTDVSFTAASATSGQYSDDAVLEASLTKVGLPVAGAQLTFAIGGVEATATTGDDGIARVTLPLDQTPGAYEARVRYAGEPGSLGSDAASAPFTILKEVVSVDFTAASATSGQYSDEATLVARLTDDDGQAVGGTTVAFSLGDATSVAPVETGAASATFLLTASPGAYASSVTFAGDDLYEPAAASSEFTILKEATTLSLSISGKGSKKTLTATLLDDDGVALASRTIQFGADGAPMPNGLEVTDSNGVATYQPSGRYAASKTYYVEFAGDDRYAASRS